MRKIKSELNFYLAISYTFYESISIHPEHIDATNKTIQTNETNETNQTN
jgi:hypothetical protein